MFVCAWKGADKLDSILHRAEQEFGKAFTIHRLDEATSGLILVAKTHECQKRMNAYFREREVQKEYRALLRGKLLGERGEVRKPLRCDWPNRPRQIICTDEWSKDSITFWEKVAYEGNTTRVRLTPYTGRSHQLRVHMQSIGHSIIGDEFYDNQYSLENDSRLLLHAYRLEFRHPFTKAWVAFVAACPF
ncbi:RluA family pseudouridine synthase [Marinomonas primoryensis]|uniref:RluA family pseudouridine synthase n=1 Tax=Marinomonas primoryensis TaxID=178399 RepID=UPI001EF9010B|nr:RluA family pseudouridine synthase [Marinomonas primoryensis]